MTAEQLTARDLVVDAARALLSGGLDVLLAAERISGPAHVLDPHYEDPDLRTFVGIHSEVDKYLIRDSVKGWHPAVRGEREAEYQRANELYSDRARRAAEALIGKLAPPA